MIALDNDIRQIPRLTEYVEGVARQAGLDAASSLHVALALEEAVANVMRYAYPEGKKGQVQVEAEAEDGLLRFVVSDQGVPFDPTAAPSVDVSAPLEKREVGGLGIHLVRQIMEEVRYRREGGWNRLTLTKKI